MTAVVFDRRSCTLGESALWHPERSELFWLDITGRRMMSRTMDGSPRTWCFDEMVSACAWIDGDTLLLASETGLFRYHLSDSAQERICELDAHDTRTRSNDGRADRHGGFWISTMGKKCEAQAGAIWRWYQGELRCLFTRVTVPNGICFSLDGRWAYFADTPRQQLMRVALDARGWPTGVPAVWLDLSAGDLYPDGAVVDAQDSVWIACWGGSRLVTYRADGTRVGELSLPAPYPTCPAYGGPSLGTLLVTTARGSAAENRRFPESGKTLAVRGAGTGIPEPAVRCPPGATKPPPEPS